MKKVLPCFTLFIISFVLLSGCNVLNKTKNVELELTLLPETINLNSENTSDILKIIYKRGEILDIKKDNIDVKFSDNKINIKLSKVKDPEKAISLFSIQGKIEFWELYSADEMASFFMKVNKKYSDTTNTIEKKKISKAGDINFDNIDYDNIESLDKILEDSVILKKDNNSNKLFSKLIIPSSLNPLDYRSFSGISYIKDTGDVISILRQAKKDRILDRNMYFSWGEIPEGNDSLIYLYTLKSSVFEKKPALDGRYIESSTVDIEMNQGSFSVGINFNKQGTALWARLTEKNINKGIAISLDNRVLTAPIVQTTISKGKAKISGNFSKEEAELIAMILNTGTQGFPFQFKVSKALISDK